MIQSHKHNQTAAAVEKCLGLSLALSRDVLGLPRRQEMVKALSCLIGQTLHNK